MRGGPFFSGKGTHHAEGRGPRFREKMRRVCSLGAGPKDCSPRKGPPHATRHPALTSRPRLGGADSDLRGPRLEGSAPCARDAPGLCLASPSDSRGSRAPPSPAGQSALPAPALAHAAANERARYGPPPPAGGGRRGAGRVRPPPAQEPGAWRRNREGRERGPPSSRGGVYVIGVGRGARLSIGVGGGSIG